MATMIWMEDIIKTYRLGDIDVPVLKGINLSIEEGEYVAIMGMSGSGKNTDSKLYRRKERDPAT